MTIRSIAGAALLALGLVGLPDAGTAAPYQPGMRTMVQQGGKEHGVQPGRRGTYGKQGVGRGSMRSRRMQRRKRAR